MSEEVEVPAAPPPVIMPAKSEDKLEIEKEEKEKEKKEDENKKDEEEEKKKDEEKNGEEEEKKDGEKESEASGGGEGAAAAATPSEKKDRFKLKTPKLPGFLRSHSKERNKKVNDDPISLLTLLSIID